MRLGIIAAIAVLLTVSTAALADPALVGSSPAADAAVAAPRAIRLMFGEKVTSASGVALSMGDGMGVSTVMALSDDGKTLTARPTGPFMAGKWTLSWHAVSAADGSRGQGAFSFTIQ
jgi:methionine-rich copper-binding protein CopC